ncbi:hypothetical protein [Lysinibacillus sp. NPDC086135]|uniref:hypothetical protein n=1 Tax=Lysinibacillus sp. NPDC086135 TaxID=3364130 RepID=UPI00380971D1
MFKRINWKVKSIQTLAIVSALTLSLMGNVTANAATSTTPDEKSLSAMSSINSDQPSTYASWGEVTITWNGKDYAYSTMSTYAGTAYYLYAKISGTDANGSIPPETNHAYNDSSTTTKKLFSRSTKNAVTWTAYGEIRDTSSSGTQTATLSKTEL